MLAGSASARSACRRRARRRRARREEGRARGQVSSGASSASGARMRIYLIRRAHLNAARVVNVVKPTEAALILRRLRRASRRQLLLQERDALARPFGSRARALHRAHVLLGSRKGLGVLPLALAHAAEVNEELRALVAHQLDCAHEGRIGLLQLAEVFVETTEVVEGYGVARRLAVGDDEQAGDGLLRALQPGEREAEFEVGGREVAAVALDGAAVERDGILAPLPLARIARVLQEAVSLPADYERAEPRRRRTRLAQGRRRLPLHRRACAGDFLTLRRGDPRTLQSVAALRPSLFGRTSGAPRLGGDVRGGHDLAARDRDLARDDSAAA